MSPIIDHLHAHPDHLTAIARTIFLDEAARLGYRQVFLGTDTPDFYARFGALAIDQAIDTLVVMRWPTPSETDDGQVLDRLQSLRERYRP